MEGGGDLKLPPTPAVSAVSLSRSIISIRIASNRFASLLTLGPAGTRAMLLAIRMYLVGCNLATEVYCLFERMLTLKPATVVSSPLFLQPCSQGIVKVSHVTVNSYIEPARLASKRLLLLVVLGSLQMLGRQLPYVEALSCSKFLETAPFASAHPWKQLLFLSDQFVGGGHALIEEDTLAAAADLAGALHGAESFLNKVPVVATRAST